MDQSTSNPQSSKTTATNSGLRELFFQHLLVTLLIWSTGQNSLTGSLASSVHSDYFCTKVLGIVSSSSTVIPFVLHLRADIGMLQPAVNRDTQLGHPMDLSGCKAERAVTRSPGT